MYHIIGNTVEAMANNLRKYKFTGGVTATGPKASSSTVTTPTSDTRQSGDQMDIADMKAEILTSLKTDIAMLLRSEIKTALPEDFDTINSELLLVKTELATHTSAIRSEKEAMKTTVSQMEQGLSSCSDDVTALLTKVGKQKSTICGRNALTWKGE